MKVFNSFHELLNNNVPPDMRLAKALITVAGEAGNLGQMALEQAANETAGMIVAGALGIAEPDEYSEDNTSQQEQISAAVATILYPEEATEEDIETTWELLTQSHVEGDAKFQEINDELIDVVAQLRENGLSEETDNENKNKASLAANVALWAAIMAGTVAGNVAMPSGNKPVDTKEQERIVVKNRKR